MPSRFNKSERDEFLKMAKTCAACKDGDCSGCKGSSCACSQCHGASVLDALESKTAGPSMPPEAGPAPEAAQAQPYNPGAYEGMVDQMHPAAQFKYERAVQQGATPQAAMAAAQEQQTEMMERAQQGQNTEGVQIPVIGHADDVDKNPVAEIIHSDFGGFVPVATVQRVAKLLS